VSIEGASKLEVSAMVSETDITKKKENACQHFSEIINENLRVK
jgi:hypothetical protein